MLLMGWVTAVGARPVAAATTFTVTKTADTADGTCDSDGSLHEAADDHSSGQELCVSGAI